MTDTLQPIEYRAYFFGNMYLSSIQQGIQAAHVVADMFMKYEQDNLVALDILHEWATSHKTMVLLNAGYSEEIRALHRLFDDRGNKYPYDYFTEAAEALDGALTCIGIVLPNAVYETAKALRERVVSPASIENTGRVRYLKTPSGLVPYEGSADGLANFIDVEQISYEISKWEFEMASRLNRYGLAR